jgi:hypothetical protein
MRRSGKPQRSEGSGQRSRAAIMTSAARRAVIVDKLREGSLPRDCTKLWAGPGTGARCAACGDSVTAPALEYECLSRDGHVFNLCQPCFVLWDAEIKRHEEQ